MGSMMGIVTGNDVTGSDIVRMRNHNLHHRK
jgi:hypothetical protein